MPSSAASNPTRKRKQTTADARSKVNSSGEQVERRCTIVQELSKETCILTTNLNFKKKIFSPRLCNTIYLIYYI